MIRTLDCAVVDAITVLKEEADVTSQTIAIGIVLIAAITDQDTYIVTEIVSERTFYALIISLGFADCSNIGDCSPKRRVLLQANFIFQ